MMLSRWRSSSSATCVSQKRERQWRKNVSLFKRGNTWHFAFLWNGRRYRGSCKTSRQAEAKKVEALVLARLLEDGRLPWSRKVPTLAGLSNRFFKWLESLPADRPPKPPTRRYYRVGWQLLESTSIAGMKLDHITADHALTIEGSSAANTNNALRTLRRMLKKAQEWQLLYRSDCQTRRGTGAGRVDRAVDGAAAAGGYRGLASYRERQEVACGLGAVSNGAVDHAGFRSSSRRDLPHALGKHPLGQRADLQPAWQVPKIPALRPAHRARQRSTRGAQGRRERRMGLSLEASPVRLHHRP